MVTANASAVFICDRFGIMQSSRSKCAGHAVTLWTAAWLECPFCMSGLVGAHQQAVNKVADEDCMPEAVWQQVHT